MKHKLPTVLRNDELSARLFAASQIAPHKISFNASKHLTSVVFDLISEALTAGFAIRIPGHGTLFAYDAPARKGRNSQTGEVLDIPARKRTKFRPFPKPRNTAKTATTAV